jgi:hypothetical protein
VGKAVIKGVQVVSVLVQRSSTEYTRPVGSGVIREHVIINNEVLKFPPERPWKLLAPALKGRQYDNRKVVISGIICKSMCVTVQEMVLAETMDKTETFDSA